MIFFEMLLLYSRTGFYSICFVNYGGLITITISADQAFKRGSSKTRFPS